MNFVSFEYLLFLPLVFFVYWFALKSNLKLQNLFLVFASYVLYGWWDWRFLSLIILSSFVDFWCGLKIDRRESNQKRKLFLVISLLTNLGILGVFKYYNFFISSLADALLTIGVQPNLPSLQIILPVGISFYTFQTLSYTIDVYRKKLESTDDWVSFFAYVAFFPQLVAGPIERASHLLPQFAIKRKFDYEVAFGGVRQIIWGFFKKVAIADNCALIVDEIFSGADGMSSPLLILGAFYFAIQIYCDFSGYSDIAIGCSKLLGFDLRANFRYPYFSRDMAEFWRRWHISLSTWFRDYVYIPLGGSRGGTFASLRNVMIVFLVSGLWHGANWTYVIWGLINALMFVPLLLCNWNRSNLDEVAEGRLLPSAREFVSVLATFSFTCLAWIYFRSETVTAANEYIWRLFTSGEFGLPIEYLWVVPLIAFLLCFEWINRLDPFPTFKFKKPALNILGYFGLIYMASAVCRQTQTFIYFQF